MQREVLKITFQFHTEQNTTSWYSLLLRILVFEKANLSNKIKSLTGCTNREGNEHKDCKEKTGPLRSG